jgi:hypothetical protein
LFGEELEKLHDHLKALPLVIVPIKQPQVLDLDENNLENVHISLN